MRAPAALLMAVAGLSSCLDLKPEFRCAFDNACVVGSAQGICQPTGYCSFADPGCPLGQRYGGNAGELSHQCVATTGDPGAPLPPLPLATTSRWIVDAQGRRFKLASVNWYGAEEKDYVVGGLDKQDLGALSRWIRQQGFNSVRLPWSNEMVETNPVIADALLDANPQLRGKRALEVLDAVIAALAHEGLVVILDNHMSNADWCCSATDGNGLWYTTAYPESAWLADWQSLAQRYADQPAVVGADLRNSPRPVIDPPTCTTCTACPCATATGCTCRIAAWGGADPSVDWRAAAIRGAQTVLDASPGLLVFVEGVNYAGDLSGAYTNPIDLGPGRRDRLVYAVHDFAHYHAALIAQASPQPQDLEADLAAAWSDLLLPNQGYTAPVWVDAFSTCHTMATCLSDTNGQGWWFSALRTFLAESDVDWAYFALDGTEARGSGRMFGAEDTTGLLDVSWDGPASTTLLVELQSLQVSTQGP